MTSNNQATFNEQSFVSEETIYVLSNEQSSRALQEVLARLEALEAANASLEARLSALKLKGGN